MLARIALVALALSFSACDSTETYMIGGTYSGTINDADFAATLTIVLPDIETGDSFSFTGTRVQFDETVTLSGTGTYDYPSLTLTVGGDTANVTVSEDGNTLRFTFDDVDDTYTLTRQ